MEIVNRIHELGNDDVSAMDSMLEFFIKNIAMIFGAG
jgi:hypothetical protein